MLKTLEDILASIDSFEHDLTHHSPFGEDDPRVANVSEVFKSCYSSLSKIRWVVELLEKESARPL